jgi:hypothetical protein
MFKKKLTFTIVILTFLFSSLVFMGTAFAEGPTGLITLIDHSINNELTPINFVILGDGYTAAQEGTFINDASDLADSLLASPAYAPYAHYINIHCICVDSNSSGASQYPDGDPSHVHVDTYFGSRFYTQAGQAYLDRLLTPEPFGIARINSILNDYMPMYDQAILLVNSNTYGGSGDITNSLTTVSKNASSRDIMLHELGHSFAGLWDEYWCDDVNGIYAQEKINMTQTDDPDTVGWSKFVGYNGVDVYPFVSQKGEAAASTWYRPSQSCKMCELASPFCPVCLNAYANKIHEILTTKDIRLEGDANDDGVVDGDDVTAVAEYCNSNPAYYNINIYNADLDNNGIVNFLDYIVLRNTFNI